MNYIKQLQQENSELKSRIDDTDQAIRDFEQLLNLPKHNGVDCNGDRSDWIATSDALRQLNLIQFELFKI